MSKKNAEAAAQVGLSFAMQVIDEILNSWNSPAGPSFDAHAEMHMQAFFLFAIRTLRNAAIDYDSKPVVEILTRMALARPVGHHEIVFLRNQLHELGRLLATVEDFAPFRESSLDVGIYELMHNREWVGIGEAPAGSSAGM